MDVNIESKQFKVSALSSNLNSFGLRNHILIAEDGEAWQAAASELNVRKQGEIIKLHLDLNDVPDFAYAGFEIPSRLPNAPRNVVNEVW